MIDWLKTHYIVCCRKHCLLRRIFRIFVLPVYRKREFCKTVSREGLT